MQTTDLGAIVLARRGRGWLAGVSLASLLIAIGCGEAPKTSDDDGRSDPHAGSGATGGSGATQDMVSGMEVGTAAAATPSPVTLAEPTWFYRIDLARDATGTMSVQRVSAVKAGIRPIPGFGGDYWAIAYAGTQVTGAVPLIFPTEGQDNHRDADGDFSHTSFTLTNTSATAFVEATGVDRVTITGNDGADVLEIAAAALPPLRMAKKVGSNEPIGTENQAVALDGLRTRYPTITFVGAGDEATVLEDLVIGGSLVTINDMMANVIDDGLSRLPPALLASVLTVGVKDWSAVAPEKFSTNAQSAGGAMLLNLDALFDTDSGTGGMARTIVHEAAHRLWSLVNRSATGGDASEWPASVASDAVKLAEKYQLMLGIDPVWQAIQQSGVEQGIASDYAGGAWETAIPTEEAARAMGFATRRGGISLAEDFAETAATANVKPSDRNICKSFTGQPQVGPEVAIPYAKLALVTSLGALSEADFASCVGATQFKTQPGIEMNGVLFNQNNKAGPLEIDGAPYFGLYGEGQNTYKLLIRLSLPTLTTPPLGLHRLDALTLTQVGAEGRSEVLLGNDDERLNRGTAWGLVLITEASKEQTRGAILGLILHNGFGDYTDYVPFGTFQIAP